MYMQLKQFLQYFMNEGFCKCTQPSSTTVSSEERISCVRDKPQPPSQTISDTIDASELRAVSIFLSTPDASYHIHELVSIALVAKIVADNAVVA
mmetsp:Transcript_13247/g.18933  ORF Transcript_13247/g.18933 Transcript_13247/m.18933 type:complete len:94 (+) Transcript_13247:226-507(+)